MGRGPSSGCGIRRTSIEVTTLVPAQASTGRLAAHSPRPSPSWAMVGVNDDMPMIPAPRTSEPPVAARNRGCRSSSGSSSGAATRRSTRTNATSATSASAPSTTVGTSTPLRPWVSARDREGHRGDQQHQPGHVDPAPDGGRGLGDPAQARRHQQQREHGGHPVGSAASRTRSRGAPPARRRPRCRGRRWRPRPTWRASAPGRAGSGARARPARRPARPHRRRPATTRAATKSTGSRATAQRTRPAPWRPARRRRPGDGRGCHPARRRRAARGQADAHRAEDPGPCHRAGAEVGRGRGDRRDRRHVGDEHQRGAEGDGQQRTAGVDCEAGQSV